MRFSYRIGLAQSGDLAWLESELLEHAVRMLADRGRPRNEPARRPRQSHRLADELHHLALLFDRLRDTEVLDLRIRKGLVDRVDRAARHAILVEPLDPV